MESERPCEPERNPAVRSRVRCSRNKKNRLWNAISRRAGSHTRCCAFSVYLPLAAANRQHDFQRTINYLSKSRLGSGLIRVHNEISGMHDLCVHDNTDIYFLVFELQMRNQLTTNDVQISSRTQRQYFIAYKFITTSANRVIRIVAGISNFLLLLKKYLK